MTPIVSAAALEEHLSDPDWVVIDCRFKLTEPDAGYRSYLQGHIPGAHYAHLDKDLARVPLLHEGRHPLPDPPDFARCLRRWGVRKDSSVIVYDNMGGAIASRLWWMLRWAGHERTAVLDGGLQAWEALAQSLERDEPIVEPSEYTIESVRSDWVVGTPEMETLDFARTVLFDARSEARFRGQSEPIDPVAGHVPGATCWPFDQNLGNNTRELLPAEEILANLDERVEGSHNEAIVAMCGSGVTACHLLWALECAGVGDARLYVGSWSEWIRDPERTVAKDGD